MKTDEKPKTLTPELLLEETRLILDRYLSKIFYALKKHRVPRLTGTSVLIVAAFLACKKYGLKILRTTLITYLAGLGQGSIGIASIHKLGDFKVLTPVRRKHKTKFGEAYEFVLNPTFYEKCKPWFDKELVFRPKEEELEEKLDKYVTVTISKSTVDSIDKIITKTRLWTNRSQFIEEAIKEKLGQIRKV